jgi:hypothetical protein
MPIAIVEKAWQAIIPALHDLLHDASKIELLQSGHC